MGKDMAYNQVVSMPIGYPAIRYYRLPETLE